MRRYRLLSSRTHAVFQSRTRIVSSRTSSLVLPVIVMIALHTEAGLGATGQPVLLKDINPGPSGSSPSYAVVMNSVFYFSANDGSNGVELWRTDGTAAGTNLVKDINPGAGSSNPRLWEAASEVITNVLYFVADDGTTGMEIWKTDGTAGGTSRIKDIRGGSQTSNPNHLVNFNNFLFFSAADGVSNTELWKSDGTISGTVMVKDIWPGSDKSSGTAHLFVLNGALYFRANDGSGSGTELWTSDGFTPGTVMVKDIYPGTSGSFPRMRAQIGGLAYLQADDDNGTELWKTDGTAAGTVLVKDIYPGPSGSNSSSEIDVNGTLYFFADNGTQGRELWKSDGTTAGTVLVKDINPGFPGSGNSGSPIVPFAGLAYFFTNEGTSRGLWKSDGTAGGTTLVKAAWPDMRAGSGWPHLVVNSKLYFRADDSVNGLELWRSDGTAAGTVLLSDINPGAAGSGVRPLTSLGKTLFLEADDGLSGSELWILNTNSPPSAVDDGLPAGTIITVEDTQIDIDVLANDSDPDADPLAVTSTVDISGGWTEIIPDNTTLGNQVRFHPDPNWVGDATFSYTIDDGDGGTATATVTVRVTEDCIDPPVASDDGPFVSLEDSPLPLTLVAPGVLLNDLDPDTCATTLTASLSTGPSSAQSFSLKADGSFTYTPNPDFNGGDSFTYIVDDGTGRTDIGTVNISIASVNDPPSFAPGTDVTVLEDSGLQTVLGWATSITPGPANESSQTVSFTVTSDNNSLFLVQPAVSRSGTLTFTPFADANRSTTITVTPRDNGGIANGGVDTGTSRSITITVTPVNDAPSFTVGADETVLEDAGPRTVSGWATNISSGPPDEVGQVLTFNVTGNTSPGLFLAAPGIDAATGDLTFETAADANGVADITVELQDDGGTLNGGQDTSTPVTFGIVVTPVNDPPRFKLIVPADQTVDEDAGTQAIFALATPTGTGPANEAAQKYLAFNVSNDNNALFSKPPVISVATGDLSYESAPDANGMATVTVTLQDGGGVANGGVDTSAGQPFTITVVPVPDIISLSPKDRSDRVDLAAPVTVVFDSAMNTGATENAFSLRNGTSPAVSGTFQWSDDASTLVFTPDEPLQPLTSYTVTVGTGATDAADKPKPIAKSTTITFTTRDITRGIFGGGGCAAVLIRSEGPAITASLIGQLLPYILIILLMIWRALGVQPTSTKTVKGMDVV